MAKQSTGMKRGRDLLATIKGHAQPKCPQCGKDVGPTALVRLVYTFEPCGCDVVPYKHLIETIWHRNCFHRPRAYMQDGSIHE